MPNDVGSCRRRTNACLRAILALGLTCLACAPTASRAAAATPALDPEERALCKLINQFRAQSGVAPLRVSPALTKAASWLSADMAANDVFDHVDSRGRDFSTRMRSFGFRGPTMGENIAGGDEGAIATFKHLKASSPHRANMLRAKFKVLGIGRAYQADTMLTWYWTTTFGAPDDRGVAC
jgi:uncharacterized protein YkwD